jgi:hypothetical protein
VERKKLHMKCVKEFSSFTISMKIKYDWVCRGETFCCMSWTDRAPSKLTNAPLIFRLYIERKSYRFLCNTNYNMENLSCVLNVYWYVFLKGVSCQSPSICQPVQQGDLWTGECTGRGKTNTWFFSACVAWPLLRNVSRHLLPMLIRNKCVAFGSVSL